MLIPRTASVAACALFLALLGLPATASALTVTAPALQSPAAGASEFREGGSIKFEWRGPLQGHPDAISRSYFRLEVIKASEMPSGAQAKWPAVENFVQTDSGEAANEAMIGVPSAGSYRWRVCAWGVVNPETANEIQQLPNGCSATRAFETSAAAAGGGAVKELVVENRTTAPGLVETVEVRRQRAAAQPEQVQPTPVAPAPTPGRTPVPTPAPEAAAPPVAAVFTALRARPSSSAAPALAIATDAGGGLGGAEPVSSRRGMAGAVVGGLGGTLPLIPIPFWTLALLLSCLPIARAWRSSVLGMFDWSDGTIDGSGSSGDEFGDLAPVLVATGLKDASRNTDGDASVHLRHAPAGRRRAA